MKLGVVGLPNVGKSTLFNAITQAGAECANYPFCTIEPNVGIVTVPDDRLPKLAALYNCKKIVYTTIEFVDIAGLVRGASKGEGLGNKFLSHIREVDAVVHVVRCFSDDNITHVDGKIDAVRDIQTINLELILADLESVAKKLDKARNLAKTMGKSALAELELLEKINFALENEKPVRSLQFSQEEADIVKGYFLLTGKPVIYCANIAESDLGRPENQQVKAVKELAAKENAETIVLCAKIEEELAAMAEDDKELFMQELCIEKSGLQKLITAGYDLLNLMSFLTAGEKETRAWTITKGTKAPQAAGKIHTDFEKGFIRAEVVDCNVLLELGSYNAAKEKGKVRSEGKDYVFKDGDVVLFRFNI